MIYIVRHGQTDWNVLGKIQGITNIPLNDKGREQAEEVKVQLQDVHFDAVFTSPLDRALDTASIIAPNAHVIIDDRLLERSYGGVEGSLKIALPALRKLNSDQALGIESIKSVRERIDEFCTEIEEKYQNKNVLVVTHAAVIAFARVYFEGEPKDHDYIGLVPDNCEVLKYNNRKKVKSLNMEQK